MVVTLENRCKKNTNGNGQQLMAYEWAQRVKEDSD